MRIECVDGGRKSKLASRTLFVTTSAACQCLPEELASESHLKTSLVKVASHFTLTISTLTKHNNCRLTFLSRSIRTEQRLLDISIGRGKMSQSHEDTRHGKTRRRYRAGAQYRVEELEPPIYARSLTGEDAYGVAEHFSPLRPIALNWPTPDMLTHDAQLPRTTSDPRIFKPSISALKHPQLGEIASHAPQEQISRPPKVVSSFNFEQQLLASLRAACSSQAVHKNASLLVPIHFLDQANADIRHLTEDLARSPAVTLQAMKT